MAVEVDGELAATELENPGSGTAAPSAVSPAGGSSLDKQPEQLNEATNFLCRKEEPGVGTAASSAVSACGDSWVLPGRLGEEPLYGGNHGISYHRRPGFPRRSLGRGQARPARGRQTRPRIRFGAFNVKEVAWLAPFLEHTRPSRRVAALASSSCSRQIR